MPRSKKTNKTTKKTTRTTTTGTNGGSTVADTCRNWLYEHPTGNVKQFTAETSIEMKPSYFSNIKSKIAKNGNGTSHTTKTPTTTTTSVETFFQVGEFVNDPNFRKLVSTNKNFSNFFFSLVGEIATQNTTTHTTG